MSRASLMALAAMLALGADHPANRPIEPRRREPDDGPPTPRPEPREYPYYNATPMPRVAMPAYRFAPPEGKKQGARVERQVRRSLGNPFAASEKCLERIKAKLAANPVPAQVRVLEEPKT